MNRKGFTLVELLATIIVLAIVVGITIPIVLSGVNKAKVKEREILLKNIRAAVRNYNLECNDQSGLACVSNHGMKTVTLGQLVENGFMSNGTGCADSDICVYEPVDATNVKDCEIYIYNNGTYGFCAPVPGTNDNPGSSCGKESEHADNPPSCDFLLMSSSND